MKAIRQKVVSDILFRELIENSYSGITLFDRDLNTIYSSPSAERITGWSPENRPASLMQNIHPDDEAKMHLFYNEVLTSKGAAKACIFRYKHINGHFIWLDCTFTNWLDKSGILAIVCNFRDVSEQKHADELLKHTVDELMAYKYCLDESAIVAITDHKGVITHVNDYFCKLSKYSREELVGQDHRILNSGYHSKTYIKNLWATIGKGKIWKGEFRNKAKDGTFYWVEATVVPFLNKKNKPYQYIAIRSDITELKKALTELTESEERYSDQFNYSPSPMWVNDAETLCFLDVNIAAVKHYQYSREEFLAMTLKDIRPVEEIPLLEERLAIDRLNKQPHTQRLVTHRLKNGDLREVDIQISRINYKGRPANVVIANDVTEKLAHIKAVEEQNKKLKEISWMQSHVVRAPLARLMGLMDLFKTDCDEKEKVIEYMISSARELDEVIRGITDISKTDDEI